MQQTIPLASKLALGLAPDPKRIKFQRYTMNGSNQRIPQNKSQATNKLKEKYG
jgi:hypothetical protein